MPEAVIVSAARSPIGRAGKGSLCRSVRRLAAQMVRGGRWTRCPSLDPTQIDDLIMGLRTAAVSRATTSAVSCRAVGMDHLPGCTVTATAHPACSRPGWPSTPSKAGEADVFISAASRPFPFRQGQLGRPPTSRTRCSPTPGSYGEHRRARRRRVARPPREDDAVPDVYIAMGQTAEKPGADQGHQPRGDGRVRRPLADLAEKAIAGGFWPVRSPR